LRHPLHLIFAVVLLFTHHSATAIEREIFHKHAQGSLIQPGLKFKIKDDKFGTADWSKIDTIVQVKNMIILEINEDTAMVLPDTFTLKVTVRVWYYKDTTNQYHIATTKDIILYIHYDSTQKNAFQLSNFLFGK